MTDIIRVEEKEGLLVIDSRLIAADLGIAHKNFLSTIDKYLEEIEDEFGTLAFETREFKTSQGNTSTERYTYLLEDQATYVMTLSKNTPKVRRCKRKLVKAFSEAKKIIPAQQQEIQKLQLELQLAKERQNAANAEQKLLSTVQVLEAVSPGLAPLALGKSDAIVERIEVVEHHAVVDETGKTVADRTGKSRTAIAKSLGMKKAKDLNEWLQSIGREDLLETGVTVIACEYIPSDRITEIRQLWAQHKGTRQKLIGEL